MTAADKVRTHSVITIRLPAKGDASAWRSRSEMPPPARIMHSRLGPRLPEREVASA